MLQATAPRGVLTDELKQEIATNKEQLLSVIADLKYSNATVFSSSTAPSGCGAPLICQRSGSL